MSTVTNQVSNAAEVAFTGISDKFIGILGVSKATGHAGIAGFHDEGNGVGVYGHSQNAEAVFGESKSLDRAAIAAFMTNEQGRGAAIHAENHGKGVGIFAKGAPLAARFEGNVEVMGGLFINGINFADYIGTLHSTISYLQSEVQRLQSELSTAEARARAAEANSHP